MKKILLFIVLLSFSILNVYAKDNKLYFTEKDNRLYYEGSFIDDVFLKHTDMVPGAKYRDELIIENGTDTKYKLYFKIVPRKQSHEANELLENIEMIVKLDNKEIYNGKATGLNYNGINLQNSILIGEFSSSDKSKMIVDTKLSETYDNSEFNDFSYINWTFYAQYGDNREPSEIIVSPNTLKNSFPYMCLISIIIVLIGFGVIFSAIKIKN